jgi:hypothetical protein
MNRTIIRGALAAAVLTGTGLALALSGTAEAATVGKTINASTHVAGVPDTTVGSTLTNAYEDGNGQVTYDPAQSVYGPVWAIDEITNTYQVKPLGGDMYAVSRQANGTFVAFAQPNTNDSVNVAPLNGVNGQVHGTISYTVHSVNAPKAANLPAQEPLATGSHAQLKQLFPGITESDISGGGDWVFAYVSNSTGGSRMVQAWNTDSSTWGNITG